MRLGACWTPLTISPELYLPFLQLPRRQSGTGVLEELILQRKNKKFNSVFMYTLILSYTKHVYSRMWMADQCRPDYWRPNKEITRCYACKNKFDETQSPHHCRACGEGFCGECSRFKRPCVERGWGQEPQRSCKK